MSGMHVILSYSSNKLKSCVKSKTAFYNKFLAQAYILEDAKPSPKNVGTHYLSLCVFYADLHINTDVISNPENCAFNKSLPKPIL